MQKVRQTRSITGLIINPRWIHSTFHPEFGKWGEYTSVAGKSNMEGENLDIRITAVYGDSGNKQWNKSIAEFMDKHKEHVHLVGGDFNQINMFKNQQNVLTRAACKYIDVQRMFHSPPLPTRGKNVLDYVFVTHHFAKTFPINNVNVCDVSQTAMRTMILQGKDHIPLDHKTIGVQLDVIRHQEKKIPLNCIRWHKRHDKAYREEISKIEIPKELSEESILGLCDELKRAVHRINLRFWNCIFMEYKDIPSGSSELNWLRRASARGGRQFYQSVKYDCLAKPVDSKIYPSDTDICNHMEYNHSLCPQPLPAPEYETEVDMEFTMEQYPFCHPF